MRKTLWLALLFPLLLCACAVEPAPVNRPVQPPALQPPALQPPALQPPPIQATAPSAEKVVTLVPLGETTAPPAGALPAARAIDESAQETAADNLRALLGEPELTLTFKAPDRSPNASRYATFLFADPFGNSYHVSQDTLRPVEFTLTQPIREPAGGEKTGEELRAAAEQIAQTHSTRFAALRDRLTYSEGNKGENHFFRWELPGSDVGGMPAILQIGLKQDGTLFGYLNSLDLGE